MKARLRSLACLVSLPALAAIVFADSQSPASPAPVSAKASGSASTQASPASPAAVPHAPVPVAATTPAVSVKLAVLKAESFEHHVTYFNVMELETQKTPISNAEAWGWLKGNIPLFECSASEVEELYYFRWWALRKHLRKDEDTGLRVFTEFLLKPKPVSSALGLHIAEMRWLHDQAPVDDYITYWLRGGPNRGPQAVLHKYSGWLPWALWQRELVTGDRGFNQAILDDLVKDQERWEQEKRGANGLFWQYDVWDAMEESISGSRTAKNQRPTINSYQYGSFTALATLAAQAGRKDLADTYATKAAALRQLVEEKLWDPEAVFFKARLESGSLADVREELGFIPWYFELPEAGKGYEQAWAQLKDPTGFKAPYGITTAERRHPKFRTHGTGKCEWDGSVWPYATSQTLTALANVLEHYGQTVVDKSDWFDAFLTYTRSQHYYGLPYVGEYLDEQTGHWLKDRQERSFYYNHSTYADLVITGLAGLRPRADDLIVLNPLLPDKTWTWFCVDGIAYHGHTLTIVWDEDGTRYQHGKGFILLEDGRELARADKLGHLEATLRP